MVRIVWVLALWVSLVASGSASDDFLVSVGDQKYLAENPTGGKITHIKYSTLGCASILKLGDSGTAWIWLEDGGASTQFDLSLLPTLGNLSTSYDLSVTGFFFDAVYSVYKVSYLVSVNILNDMYNFQVSIFS